MSYVQLEPSTRCNFTCGFCAGRSMLQVDLSLRQFRELVDQLGDEVKHVELQGEGEPLMHPDFFDMVEYLRERLGAVRISIITNGSLLNRKNIARLLEARLYKIMVSMETADAGKFRSIRGGSLERVERGLRQLMMRKSAVSDPPAVGLAVTILKGTVDDIAGIERFHTRLGLDGGMTLQPLQTMSCYTRFYNDAMHAEVLDRDDVARFDMHARSNIALQAVMRQNLLRPIFYTEMANAAAPDTCAWLDQGLYVSANGIACGCCFMKNDREQGFGSIAKLGMAAILQAREALHDELKAGKIPPPCAGCGIAQRVAGAHGEAD